MIQTGEVWWAALPEPHGSGPGYRRPVLVVQSDAFNASKIATVLVVAISSNLNLAKAPGNVLLSKKKYSLPKDSVANVSQVLTLDKSLLAKKLTTLPHGPMEQVRDGLRLVMGL